MGEKAFLQYFLMSILFVSSEVITKVRGKEDPPFRPFLSDQFIGNANSLRDTMKSCWDENPYERPSFADLKKIMETLFKQNKL